MKRSIFSDIWSIFRLPDYFSLVKIFLIYTDLQSAADGESGGSHGLGHLDARNDNLTVILELKAPLLENTPIAGRRKGGRKRKENSQPKDLTVEIELAQDTTALHSRKGDTGSVLWRARYIQSPSIVLRF